MRQKITWIIMARTRTWFVLDMNGWEGKHNQNGSRHGLQDKSMQRHGMAKGQPPNPLSLNDIWIQWQDNIGYVLACLVKCYQQHDGSCISIRQTDAFYTRPALPDSMNLIHTTRHWHEQYGVVQGAKLMTSIHTKIKLMSSAYRYLYWSHYHD